MCGIAGYHVKDESLSFDREKMLDTLLREIDHRGGHATGYAAMNHVGLVGWQKAACDADDFCKNRRPMGEGPRTVIGHTRYATQGIPAFPENNHPIRRGPFYLIHNGHVWNDDELFTKSERKRYGDVDSEAIVAYLSSMGAVDHLPSVMQAVEGDAAVAALDERLPGVLALARGAGSPLYVLDTRRLVVFASTMTAVVNAYQKHVGSIDKDRVTYIPEGTSMIWRDHTLVVERFEPKKKTYTPAITGGWWGGNRSPFGWDEPDKDPKDTTSDPDDPYADKDVACDGCGEPQTWNEVGYENDHTGYTWILCDQCNVAYRTSGEESIEKFFDSDFEDDSMFAINERIVREIEEGR